MPRRGHIGTIAETATLDYATPGLMRTRAAEQLDTAGTLTPDQRLLRVLLDDNQPAFEQALQQRLVTHRESVGTDPAAQSLLPVGAVTLTALAQLAHGWQVGIRSAYLPEALLSTSQR
ncbi:Imm49 family immunity protein [Micromonospora sp. NPDC023888]|uniref:Imm49 family immunity protein n=1 Tax=Micromonospora sp. NPDC023888 TaxID=3155607 RepID=UPI0033F7A38E